METNMSSASKVRSLESAVKSPASGSQIDIDSTSMAVASRTPELVIALCGPIGSPIHETAQQTLHALSEFGYQTATVKLSDLIRINAADVGIPIVNSSKFSEIRTRYGSALGMTSWQNLRLQRYGVIGKKNLVNLPTRQTRSRVLPATL